MTVCEDNDYCYIEIPKKGELLKYQPGVKSSTTQKNKHEMCRYSLFTNCSFDKKECD